MIDEEVNPSHIAKMVNVSTGRGSLGRLGKIGEELNIAIFSPRLVSSRLTMLNPKYYHDLDPFVRKEAIKSLFAMVVAGTIISNLYRLNGASIGTNPLSSEFGKARMGDIVVDPYGGLQQNIVTAVRFAMGKTDSTAKGAFAPTRGSIIGNFATNKLSPLASLAYTLATSKENTKGERVDRFGNPLNIRDEAISRFIPIFVQDINELIQTDADFKTMLSVGAPVAFGVGMQVYDSREERELKRKSMQGFRKPKLSLSLQ